ncbi:restriction endonuclease subunit S [Phascolarctobacterium succinatutens]|uniref:restriction endonuclease subunit S n=3 Tax=Phascolarctobacterium succinatutens TaxID=626940 RepID=UPI0026F20D1F|nr:restriction endonuclease subunit S [Phascolarctobacterium succinatutens]
MREMKDSGIEWIGEIPKDWEITKIGMLYNLRITKVSDTDYAPLSVTKMGVLPQLETVAKTNAHDDRKLVKKGDFVINSRSDRRGSCGISDYYGSVSLINIVLEPKNNMSSGYYSCLFKTVQFADEFYKNGHGIVDDLWTTGWQDMKRIILPVPHYSEQQQIADYLDTKCSEIDATAEDIQKEIDLLEDYKKSVITEVVTKGLNPDAEMKDSGIEWIGEIPKGWKIIRLKYITNSIGDGLHGTPNYDDLGTIFFINGNNLGNRKISITEKTNRLTEEEYKKCGVVKLDKCTLLMSLNGTYGTLSMYDNEPIMLSKSVGYINVCNKETKEYLYYFLQSSLAQNQMTISLAGTTIANLSLATVRNLKICLPSICEQQQIADYLDIKCSEIDALIADKKRQLDILADYKKSLIYEYVTGKKEVPVKDF